MYCFHCDRSCTNLAAVLELWYAEMHRRYIHLGHRCSQHFSFLLAAASCFWLALRHRAVHTACICVACGKTSNQSPGYAGRGPSCEEVWRCRNCWVDLYSQGLERASSSAEVFALGPSHFERKALTAAGFPWQEVCGNILKVGKKQKQHILGVASLPVYNQITLQLLRQAYNAYGQVVWCVSNWFFGNRDVERLRSLGKDAAEDLFLWADFSAGNVERDLITPENTDLLVRHSARCIDFVLSEMPRTKLLFWCLAKRTFNKQGRSKQIPLHGQYEAFIKRYQNHSLDVLRYHDKDTFDRVCCQDRSGHPTLLGYQTISQLLEDASAGWSFVIASVPSEKVLFWQKTLPLLSSGNLEKKFLVPFHFGDKDCLKRQVRRSEDLRKKMDKIDVWIDCGLSVSF